MGFIIVLQLDLTEYIRTTRDLPYTIILGTSLRSKSRILFWGGRV
jgi:hypothetical protein